jgi:hypothetical protein
MTETDRTIEAGRPTRTSALGLRAGLRRLGTFLLVYGVIGLLIAGLGLAAVAWTAGRVDALAERVETEVGLLADRVDASADALADASATASSFATTLEQAPSTITQAATALDSARTSLVDIESRLAAFTILGSTPLSTVADRFGQIADDLAGIDTRLTQLAANLAENRDRLTANAASLDALAGRLSEQSTMLRSGIIGEGIDDIGTILTVMLLLFTAWTAVPAIGAIGVGLWLRREVDPDRRD